MFVNLFYGSATSLFIPFWLAQSCSPVGLRYALRQPTNHAISILPPLGPISGSRLAIMLPQISPVKMPTLGSAFSRNRVWGKTVWEMVALYRRAIYPPCPPHRQVWQAVCHTRPPGGSHLPPALCAGWRCVPPWPPASGMALAGSSHAGRLPGRIHARVYPPPAPHLSPKPPGSGRRSSFAPLRCRSSRGHRRYWTALASYRRRGGHPPSGRRRRTSWRRWAPL